MTLTLEMVAGWLKKLEPDVERLSERAVPHYEVRAPSPREQRLMRDPMLWIDLDCGRNVHVVYPCLDVIEEELDQFRTVRVFMAIGHEVGHCVQEDPYAPPYYTLRERAELKRPRLTGEWIDAYSQWEEGSVDYLVWSVVSLMLDDPDALTARLVDMFGNPGFDLDGDFVIGGVGAELGYHLALLMRAGEITKLEEPTRLPGLPPFPDAVGKAAREKAEYFLGLRGVPLYHNNVTCALGLHRCGMLIERGMPFPELLANPIRNRKMLRISRG